MAFQFRKRQTKADKYGINKNELKEVKMFDKITKLITKGNNENKVNRALKKLGYDGQEKLQEYADAIADGGMMSWTDAEQVGHAVSNFNYVRNK